MENTIRYLSIEVDGAIEISQLMAGSLSRADLVDGRLGSTGHRALMSANWDRPDVDSPSEG